jgi:transposase
LKWAGRMMSITHWLAWVLERIQDHQANRINDLMPWAYQDMIDAKNAEAEAEAKDAA